LLPILYINLEQRPDRRAFMEGQFARLGLTATRIAAATPAEVTLDQRDRYCNPRRYRWMSPAAFACSLSHLKALASLLETGAPLGLILEDDAELSSRLPAVLAAMEQSPPRFDIIRIEANPYPVRLQSAVRGSIAGVDLHNAASWAVGSAGYLASRRAATHIAAGDELFRNPVDEALFNPYRPLGRALSIAHCDPGLCIQLDAQTAAGASNINPPAGPLPDAARPAAPIRLAFAVRGILDRDIRMGGLKLWAGIARGARKRRVPFLA
jgi:glycosyl transferase family 25